MADLVYSFKTTLSPEDVVVRAVQFFSGTKLATERTVGAHCHISGHAPNPMGTYHADGNRVHGVHRFRDNLLYIHCAEGQKISKPRRNGQSTYQRFGGCN